MHLLVVLSDHFLTEKSPLAGIFQWHQAQVLKNAGFKVGILSQGFRSTRDIFSPYPYVKQEENEGIHIFRNYPRRFIPLRLFTAEQLCNIYVRYTVEMFEEYVSIHGMPDCIHAHNVQFAGISAVALKKKYGLPVILTEHSSTFARGQISKSFFPLIAEAINEATVRTTVSSMFSKLLNERIFAENNFKFDTLNNILDSSFNITSNKKSDRKEFVFLNVARADENKDQQNLIRAFARKFIGKNVVLRIGGDGPVLNDLKSLANELGLSKQVFFLGLLNRDQVKEEMINADCFVLSSKYETFGVVLIEALACGTPVISTRCYGPEDIVSEENGILVPIEDPEALSEAMLFLSDNLTNYQSDIIKYKTIEKFGEKAFLKKYLNIYRKATSPL